MKFGRNVKRVLASVLTAVMVVSSCVTNVSVNNIIAAESAVAISAANGYQETASVTWAPVENATGYKVYVKSGDSSYVQIDNELIRNYGSYFRADALGLKAGNYQFKVVAIVDGQEVTAESSEVSVENYDRSGFAFVNGSSSGAYNEDGTLKSNAVVLYLTEENKDTMKLDVVTSSKGAITTGTGIVEILTLYKKGYDNRPLDIRVIGKVTNSGELTSNTDCKGDMVISGSGATKRISCGITVEGVGEDATAFGWGIRVKNASNVEIRNLGFMACSSDEGDNVGLQQDNDHVWVHNCDMFYGMAGGDSDQAKGDGALDCKLSTYVTFSYNHFVDNGKCNLLGLKEGTTEGYFITYHHNWYDHSDSRHPRVRFYSAHVYNNYYDGNAKYGVGSTLGSSVFVEANYFRNCPYPILTSMQGSDVFAGATDRDVANNATFSKENGGTVKAFNNVMTGEYTLIPYGSETYTLKGEEVVFDLNGTNSTADFDAVVVSSRDEQIGSSVVSYAGAGTYNNFDTESSMYTYSVDAPEDVPAIVTAKAGRVNGGDFKWSFNNETDDAFYGVDLALKAAVVGYTSNLVSIGGMATANNTTDNNTDSNVPEQEPSSEAQQETTAAPSTNTTPAEGAIVHNFTTDGTNSSVFTISGNLSTSKGTVNYNGLSLTQCLKIETDTKIDFNTADSAKLTLVFGDNFSKTIKIDGVKKTASDGILEVELEAGSHSITKGDSTNLYYIVLETKGAAGTDTQPADPQPADPQPEQPVDPQPEETQPVVPSTPEVVDPIPNGEKPATVKAGDVFVAPNATGSGASAEDPADFAAALTQVEAGNTIWMVAGRYNYDTTLLIAEDNAGTADAFKHVKAYGGEAILDFSAMEEDSANRGMVLDGSYWHIYGVTFYGAGDNGMLLSGDNNVIELCVFEGNHDTGLQLSRFNTEYATVDLWPSNNLILNCTSFNNKDDKTGENADGFAAKLTCGEGNVFDGCLSYNNCDDGWDLYAKTATGPIGVVTLKNCIAFRNGKLTDGSGSAAGDMNGFKLGGSGVGTPHIVENCIAFENGACGFTDNNNPTAITLKNCTAINNSVYAAKSNFNLYREVGGINEGLVSINTNGKNTSDALVGTIENSVVYNKDKKGYLQITDKTACTKDTMKTLGSLVSVSESDFVSFTAPAPTTDFHTAWRNADGSINTQGVFEAVSTSVLAEIGANLVAYEMSENPAAEVVEETPSVDDSAAFELWFNTDGATAVVAGQQGEYPVFAGENMAAKTNKITVDGVDYYSVQGSTNPQANGANPNGKIPTTGAYLKVVAPADGSITVYGYAAAKPFYATNGDTPALAESSAFDNATHSHTVSVKAGEEWYFYAQGSKAQFIGVKFELPKPVVTIPVSFTGDSLGDSEITFTNVTTKDAVTVDKDATSVALTSGYKYTVAINSASAVIDMTELDLTQSSPKSITIAISLAPKHEVSGAVKGLIEGAEVTSLVFTDANGVATEATVDGLSYTVSLKNGDYTASATVANAEGYTVFDHVAVVGSNGEKISNDVWFYAPAKTYSTEYKAELKVGKADGCDYETITEAIAAAKAMTRTAGQYVTIVLTDAEYAEQVIVDAADIKLVAAEGVEPTVRWYYGIGYKYYSLDSTGYYNEKNANDQYEMNYAQRWGATVRIKATGFRAEGINFVNTFNRYVCDEELGDSMVGNATEYGQSMSGSLQERVAGLDVANNTNVERAAAVAVDADDAEFNKCSFVSSQDTLYTGSAHSYYKDCTIVGQTDYIFGNTGCTAEFDNCELRWLGYTAGSKAGYITATRGSYVFDNCEIKNSNEADHITTPGYFGRPWGNTAEVTFKNTTIEANAICADGWASMSGVNPEDVKFYEDNNTVDGKVFVSAKGTSLSDVPTEPETPATPSGTVEYVFEASALTAFAAGAKADGDTEKAGTENYFTLVYSAKSKVDSSSKVFDDEYASAQRVNFGGAASASKNAVKFTTENPATVTVWWVEGGDDNRQMAILDASGNQVAVTDLTVAKNATAISKFELTEAGTYYLGGATNNNYIFKILVEEEIPAEPVTYSLEASALTAFAAGAKADGDEEKAGSENYFTLIYSAKTKIDSSSKTFEDEYASAQRVNFGGAMSTSKNAVKFTTSSPATVKVWWVEGGDDNRQMAILDASGKQVAVTDLTVAKNATAISTFELTEAGTYYLGGATNNNYIFRVDVTETPSGSSKPARADWSTVAAPVITGVDTTVAGAITVSFDMVVGYDGADKVTVKMTDADRNSSEKNSSKEGTSASVTFEPTASGQYTFEIIAVREGEADKNGAETKTVGFILPLAKPVIKSVTSTGNGTATAEWNAVAEATSYTVTVDGKSYEVSDTSCKVSGLSVGKTYTVTVVANRGDDKSAAASMDVTITADAQRVWAVSRYGSSVNTGNNGAIGSALDGKVTVYSEGGKGKIVPGSTDGLTFYYTIIDPETENFTLTADVHVDNWTLSNGQEGFGLMAADAVGKDGDGTAFWNNAYQLIASKIEYYYDGEGVTTDTSASKISMKLGLGYTAKLGVTAADVAAIKAGTITMPEGFTTESGTLETSAVSQGAGTYNLVGNYKGVEPTGNLENLVTDFKLQIQRNNTGYILRYLDNDGNVINEKLYYDLERESLTKIDADHIYLGFFASRNARITVTNIDLVTINPADDEAAVEREIEYVYPIYSIESATVANSEDYTVMYYGNADATLTITDAAGNAVADKVAVKAGQKYNFETKIALGNNEFNVTVTPDADFVPGEFKKLTSYETATFTHVVDYKKLGGEKNIYVAPNGTANGTGYKNSPVDIYTAVKYVAAGQTIVLAGGTYNLTRTVKVERGINGTADNMIYMIADPEATERPVFDFGGRCAGMILAGDYWYCKGFDVTRSADAQKGLQLSGSNNVLDQINAYKNGNTGIQVSRYLGTDEFDQWPANNLILNCTSYLNADKGYEDADGFAAKLTVGEGNVFDGCIAAYNADDGWDLFAKVQSGSIGAVTIKNSVTFRNGYVIKNDAGELDLNGTHIVNAGNGNGFKMGGDSMPGAHKLINSFAFENKAKGFDSNSCPDIKVYNSTSFNNESNNVAFYTNTAVNTAYVAENVVSFKTNGTGAENFKFKGTQVTTDVENESNFFFNGSSSQNTAGVKVTEDWFVSLDTSNAIALLSNRNADGTINMNGLLELTDKAVAGAGAVMTGQASLDETDLVVEEKAPVVEEQPSEQPTQPSEQPTQPSTPSDEVESDVQPEVKPEVVTIDLTTGSVKNVWTATVRALEILTQVADAVRTGKIVDFKIGSTTVRVIANGSDFGIFINGIYHEWTGVTLNRFLLNTLVGRDTEVEADAEVVAPSQTVTAPTTATTATVATTEAPSKDSQVEADKDTTVESKDNTVVTEVTTEAVTEASTEVATETATEAATEASTETSREAEVEADAQLVGRNMTPVYVTLFAAILALIGVGTGAGVAINKKKNSK